MLSRRALFGSVALTAIGAAGAYLWVGRATKPRVFTGIQAGVALGGYDAVAYFTDGTPTPGREDLSLLHEALLGALPTTTTAKAFRADPGRYAPKFGGYCAYAVAGGGTSGGSPKAWRIVDGLFRHCCSWLASLHQK